MTSNPMITKDALRNIHLYCYEDVQEFLSIHRTLEEEMRKPDEEMDIDLVEECLAYIELVMGEDTKFDEKTLDAKYKETLAKTSPKQDARPVKITRSKKRSVRKFFFVLAATITVLFTTLTIAAKICGYKNAWEFIRQKALEMKNFNTGEIVEESGFTLIGNNREEEFKSFEDFLTTENLNILYPQPLPQELHVETIYKYTLGDGKNSYAIMFNKTDVSLIISNYSSVDIDSFAFVETFLTAGGTFYIIQNENNTYQAICQTNNMEYIVNTSDYDTLMLLLQNTKGTPK